VGVIFFLVGAAALAAGLAWARGDGPAAPANQAVASQSAAAVAKAAERPDGQPRAAGASGRRPLDAERGDRDERRGNGRTHTPAIFRDATDQEIADILAFTGEYLPWLRQDLEKMRASDPDRLRQTCRRLRFEVAQLNALKERDAQAFRKAIEERQLRQRSQDLVAKIRAAADSKEKDALTVQLRQVLEKQFDAEMVTREAHIRGLEERLESVRKELKERAAHRQEVIQKRLDETLRSNPEPAVRPPEREPPKSPTAPKPVAPGP
jgi:hypothetical protein